MATATETLTGREETFTGEMHVLNSKGDTKITWDRRDENEVKLAREHFNELRAKHFLAFRVEDSEGRKGTQIDEFDANVERLIIVPRSIGG